MVDADNDSSSAGVSRRHEAVLGSESWPKMSGFELSVGLDDEQIAALCTYVRSSWGNRAGPVEADAVAKQR